MIFSILTLVEIWRVWRFFVFFFGGGAVKWQVLCLLNYFLWFLRTEWVFSLSFRHSLKNKLKYFFQKLVIPKPLKIAIKFYCTGSLAMKWTQIWSSSIFMLMHTSKPEACREKEFTKWEAIKFDQFLTLNFTWFWWILSSYQWL